MTFAAIPSPSTSVWHLLGFPVRAYALCIIAGIIVATIVFDRRLRHRGLAAGTSLDIVMWAVPFGIVGGRLYHVISSPQAYFGTDGDPIRALYIWEGGLGIWGAVAGGALGVWLATRRTGVPFAVFADALAPALPLAQAIGRFGNWFRNELYGMATTLPWGLRVHDMDPADPGNAKTVDGEPVVKPDLYHPTFLYEALWNVGVAVLVWALDRRFKFGRGRAFALYVMAYTTGRTWIEMMRIDNANTFFGVRLNVFTSLVLFLLAAAYFTTVRGPRLYLLPVDPPADEPAPANGTVARKPAAATYEVVSEEQFRASQRSREPIGPAAAGPGSTS